MKKSPKKPLFPPPTDGVTIHKKGKAIATTKLGSIYERTKSPDNRKWLRPIDAMTLADNVEKILAAEHESVPAPKPKTPRQQKQAEYDKRRPPRHQVTRPFPFNPEDHPIGEFTSSFLGAAIPFTESVEAKRRKKGEKSPYKIVVRRRYPLRSSSPPESVGSTDTDMGESPS
jgi:hypothetical protein